MSPKAIDRLSRLEAQAAPASPGRSLTFRVEAPSGTPVAEIVAFLRARGHAIHDGDEVFVMNLAGGALEPGKPIRDLSPELLTEEVRAAAPAGGKWPKDLGPFTFALDSPRVLH